MVGACQQNSGIFLVRGGEAGLGLGEMPTDAKAGTGRDAGDQITGAGGRLGARCWWGPDEMPAGAEAGLGGMPTTKSPGLAAGSERDAGRGQGWAGSGLGATRDRVGGSQINSKESAL